MSKLTTRANSPTRLDISDMPKDSGRALGTLRAGLVQAFNYCRKYPAKMALLKATVKFVFNKIREYELQEVAYNEYRELVAEYQLAEDTPVDERTKEQKALIKQFQNLGEQEEAVAAEKLAKELAEADAAQAEADAAAAQAVEAAAAAAVQAQEAAQAAVELAALQDAAKTSANPLTNTAEAQSGAIDPV